MRLLEIGDRGQLSFTKEFYRDVPSYAILSHTWGEDEDEITFDDVQEGDFTDKAGYAKIQFCIEQAQKDEIQYFWVDTCCINRKDNTELQYSINSMFKWYKNSEKCYVFLSDVSARKRSGDETVKAWETSFRHSKWFTRGWTLQELLAPKIVEFYSRNRDWLGTKSSLEQLIHEATQIPISALRGANLSEFSAHERMRWVSKRDTKWVEDKTYCLFGLFDVHMPLIYGEGEKAAGRLREHILEHNRKQQDEYGQPLTMQTSERLAGQIDPQESSRVEEVSVHERRKSLLESLSFEQMDSRHSTIKSAYSTTCQWLLKHPSYVDWTDPQQLPSHYGFLWINGKPGAGKSTMMKFANQHATKTKLDDEVIISFFFNARGDQLEKSTVGLYRALLVQLFHNAPDLQEILDEVQHPSESTENTSCWTVETLCHTFSVAITRLGKRRLKCFVDALDECDEQQIREMVEFFEELGQNAMNDGIQFYVCFASRHYPTIDIRNGRKLTLEGETGHSEDLARYVRSQLRAGNGKYIEDVRRQILEKANGVFMWVVLVVNILNDEFRRGRIFAVQKKLQEIPPQVNSLLKAILRRDDSNMPDLLLCLQWILFAKKPLRREEFYFAMVSGLESDTTGLSEWDAEHVTVENMNRFVLDASKGLAELTKSKTPTVQFIHESVRDYLIKEDGLRELWPDLGENLVAVCHDRLKECCERYMGFFTLDQIARLQDHQNTTEQAAKGYKLLLNARFPFLGYATRQILHHANEAAVALSQGRFLEHFPIDEWICINNLLERYDIRRYTPTAGLLYILAEHDFARLVRTMCHGNVRIGPRGERYHYPLFAALANDHPDAFRALLGQSETHTEPNLVSNIKFGRSVAIPKYQTPIFWALDQGYIHVAEILAGASDVDLNDQDRVGRTALLLSAEKGYENVVRSILAVDQDSVNTRDGHFQTPLKSSAEHGHTDIVKLLLANGADVNLIEAIYGSALSLAACNGHEMIVQMLLDGGAYTDDIDGIESPLLMAARKGHVRIVQQLFDSGARIEARDNVGMTALHMAAQHGHIEIVERLLNFGATIEAYTTGGETALHMAAQAGHDKILKLLSDSEAAIEARTFIDMTSLHVAAQNGQDTSVQQLLDSGADVQARTAEGATALHLAAKQGSERIVQLLLAHGADPESLDNDGLTALLWTREELVMNVLLQGGANIEAKDRHGRTILIQACQYSLCSIALFLLDNGANIEAMDENGATPLLHAIDCESYHTASRQDTNGNHALQDYQMQLMLLEMQNKKRLMMARQEQHQVQKEDALQHPSQMSVLEKLSSRRRLIASLLGKGANTEARDGKGNTALILATGFGDEEIVKQLLDCNADTKATNKSGKSAQMVASELGHLAILSMLLSAHTNTNAGVDNGGTGPQFLSHSDRQKTVNLPWDQRADGDSGRTASLKVFQNGDEVLIGMSVDGDDDTDKAQYTIGGLNHTWTVKAPFENVVAQLLQQCQQLANIEPSS